MKKYLRLLSMLLTLSMCAGMAFSCGKDDENPSGQPAADLTITDEFALVQPAQASDRELKAVADISSALQAIGLNLSIQDDSTEAVKNEILVGQTSRTESQEAQSALNNGDYTVKVSGSAENGYKIVLAAVGIGIESAADYFIENCLSGENAGKLKSDLLYSYTCKDVKIAGTALSSYYIVHAQESATVSDKQIQAAKYADTVELFADEIEKVIGKRPQVISDSTRLPSSKRAILFGKTTYADDDTAYSKAFASEGAYSGKLLENGNVVLAGNNACSVLTAGEAFADALLKAETELTSFDVSGEKDLIKVACIGDSITYGTNSTDTAEMNYPVYLQRMLGYDYYVEKYGAPSHSLIETDTQSFLKHGYFNQSVEAAPDVVIVMLGTNDCRTQKWEDSAYKNWRDPAREESFLAAGEKLINAYRGANADVQIYLATPPVVPQDAWLGTDWTQRIERYGRPLLAKIANEQNCSLIDIYTFSEEHPEMLEGGDGLHPQNEQYEILAQGVYDFIKDTVKKPV